MYQMNFRGTIGDTPFINRFNTSDLQRFPDRRTKVIMPKPMARVNRKLRNMYVLSVLTISR